MMAPGLHRTGVYRSTGPDRRGLVSSHHCGRLRTDGSAGGDRPRWPSRRGGGGQALF